MLASKFADYFSHGIQIKQMAGVMINFNYPDMSENMFSNIDANVDIEFQVEDDGYRLVQM